MAAWDIRYLFTYCLPTIKAPKFIPKDLPITVKDEQARAKDGGTFLRFTYDSATTSIKDVEKRVQDYLAQEEQRPWFNPFTGVRGFEVRGRPWVEDLNRFPSPRLKVVFEGPDLTEESLYALFREYGRLNDIQPPSPSSKELPRFAILTYRRLRSATAAKNCLHGIVFNGTKIHILYERKARAHLIRDWIMNHPRFSVPAAAALIAAITVTVFDPIRTWFIKAKIAGTWHIERSRAVQWVKRNTFDFMHRSSQTKRSSVWGFEREETANRLSGWLKDGSGTFVIVQGPHGSGKRELVVDGVLKTKENTLVVDCSTITDQHGDAAIISALANQIGYRPIFSSMNWISSMMDLAAQGVIGSKAGFSETVDAQMKKILEMAGTASKRLALSNKKKSKDTAAMRDEEYLELHPEQRPIVVIDNFLSSKSEESNPIYRNLAEWASVLVQSNVANVVFLSDDVSVDKYLAKSLPDRVFNSVTLGDAEPAAAKRFVLQKVGEKLSGEKEEELTDALHSLGGRLTDLEVLAQRLSIGESPKCKQLCATKTKLIAAVNEIISASASEILKVHFLTDSKDRGWTTEQSWVLCRMLASNPQVRYNEVLLDSAFSDNDDAIRAIEQSGLIQVLHRDGRPASIRCGRPVYSAAFRRLVADKTFFAKQEINLLSNMSKSEAANIAKYEAELTQLANLPKQPWEVQGRITYLLKKIVSSQANVEKYEGTIADHKKVLKTEF